MRITTFLVLMTICGSSLGAQDWSTVRALPKESRLKIRELNGHGHAEGKLLLVDDVQLTILKGNRAVVIDRATIGHIQQVRSDRIWGGAIIGAVFSLIAGATYAGEACVGREEPQCTLRSTAAWAGMGAFIDWRIQGKRTVYRAPKASANVTLMRLRF